MSLYDFQKKPKETGVLQPGTCSFHLLRSASDVQSKLEQD